MKKEKSPWNPSKRATARVSDKLPAPRVCVNCGHEVSIVNNQEIYGRAYGAWPWVYLCRGCNAYVGMHPFTNIPLGTLATKETRKARKDSKFVFQIIYISGKVSRKEAYSRLANKLGIPSSECHFGWFDAEMCKRAAIASEEILKEI